MTGLPAATLTSRRVAVPEGGAVGEESGARVRSGVAAQPVAEQFCKEVLERFDDGILDFYDPHDALRGFVEVIDRRGERHAFPVVSISMGVATNMRRTFSSEWEASAVASEMKEHAKAEAGF